MAVLASEWLAILSLALVPIWAVAVALLCFAAVRRGAEVEAELKAASFRLRFRDATVETGRLIAPVRRLVNVVARQGAA